MHVERQQLWLTEYNLLLQAFQPTKKGGAVMKRVQHAHWASSSLVVIQQVHMGAGASAIASLGIEYTMPTTALAVISSFL